MKRLSIILGLMLVLAHRAFGQYFVTNDLSSAFTIFYWTNNGSTNVFSLSTNTPPGSNFVVSIPTNGYAGLGIEPTNATMFILVPWTNMPFGTNLVSSFFTNALAAIAPAQETVPQWLSILKSYFITGAVPTQQNYWEWIDTMGWYFNQTLLKSQSAQSNATYAASIVNNQLGGFELMMALNSHAAGVGNVVTTNLIQENGFTNLMISSANDSGANTTFELTNYFNLILTNGYAHAEIIWPTNVLGANLPSWVGTYSAGVNSNCFWLNGATNASGPAFWSSNELVVRIYQ